MTKRKPVSMKGMNIKRPRYKLFRERRGIHATRDERVHAGYIYLAGKIKEGDVARSRSVRGNDNVILDFAEDGRLIGIELLNLKLMPWKKRRREKAKVR